jgi:protein TonB
MLAIIISLCLHAVAIAAASAYLAFKSPSEAAEPVCPITNFMKVRLIQQQPAPSVQTSALAPAAAKPIPAQKVQKAAPAQRQSPALQTLAPTPLATAPVAAQVAHADFIASQPNLQPGSSPSNAITARVAGGTNTAITYPANARRMGWEGTVLLNFWLNESGKPSQFRIATSSGFPELDARALQTVRTWRFESQGQPAWAALPITFKLTN